MKDDLEHMIVIGCSAGGPETVKYLVPKLDLRKSGMLIVPHILNSEILHELRNKKLKCYRLDEGILFKRGEIYVATEDNLRSSSDSSIVKTKSGTISFKEFSVSRSLLDISNIYKERTIAIILSGSGTDGNYGVRNVSSNRGKVFVQVEKITCYRADSEEPWGFVQDPKKGYPLHYFGGMPKSALSTGVVDFSGNLNQLALELNRTIA